MPHHVKYWLCASLFITTVSFGQTQLAQWHHLDPQTDSVMGISTDRAYRELLKGRKPTPIIVAVIDTGIDSTHQDLRSVLWVNSKEIAGNGKDDEHNGYVDDQRGWNFAGGRDGRNVLFNLMEETRLVARLKPRYELADRSSLPVAQQNEYDLYRRAKAQFDRKSTQARQNFERLSQLHVQLASTVNTLKQTFGLSRLDSAWLHHPPTTDTVMLKLAKTLYEPMHRFGLADVDVALSGLQRSVDQEKNRIDYMYNLRYDPHTIVGDNPTNLTEVGYGNPDLTGPDARHGTHVAGIIGANRNGDLGVQGIADQVRIMGLRAAPSGDERDKDVANAIRYAVDNGAKIINMSFGKDFSPDRQVVDEAIQYAETKGVLLIHAAGNSHQNLDSVGVFPAATYPDGSEMTNMLTVGANSAKNNRQLPAEFSNYGKGTVDVFAPGVAIMSTIPNNGYQASGGTSMAAPVVAGVAAVLKSYFPQLTPQQIKRIIVQSAKPIHTQVYKPGTKELVDFASLSKSGGIVNLYEAVKLALEQERTASRR